MRGTGCGRERQGKRENRKMEKLEKDVGIGWRRRRCMVGVREGGERVINNLDHYGQFIIGAFCL